jgi:coenzyme F420-reducing hydrogenase beta subunit
LPSIAERPIFLTQKKYKTSTKINQGFHTKMRKPSQASPAKETEDENLGTCQELFSAKSTIEGQDGGMVTALLISGLKKGMFNVAVVAKHKKGVYNAEAATVNAIPEIMASKGTTCVKVATTSKLKQLIEQGHKKIAIVGTPCQVRAVRNLQQTLKGNAPDVEIIIIGLFCFEAFNSDRLKTVIGEKMGLDIDKAEKTQIRKGKFTAHLNAKEYTCNVRDLHAASEKSCGFCSDFTAEQADISVGSAGSKKGYSTVIVRTEKGAKLLENLQFERATAEKDAIVKLCTFKRERSKKPAANLKAKTIQTPPK